MTHAYIFMVLQNRSVTFWHQESLESNDFVLVICNWQFMVFNCIKIKHC